MERTGFYTLFRREIARFMKIINQTLIAPLISSLLFIIVFGFFIGSQVPRVSGFSYLEFIIPGLVMMGIITNANSATSFSVLQAKIFKHIEEILTSPLSYFEMALALTLAGAVRGIIVGVLILIIALLFTPVSVYNIFVFLYFMVFCSVLFSAIGIVLGLWAEKFDQVATFGNFIIQPLVFFGGVFYSLSLLPETLRAISYFNPLLYMINGFRYGMLGVTDVSIVFSSIFLFVLTVLFFSWSVMLFKRGYKIRT